MTTHAVSSATTTSVVRNYVALTKPRVIELLLVTTVPVMVLAERGLPNLWLVAATVVGGALSAGSANAFNMVIDKDIDTLMGRTQMRPLVTGAITPRAALLFASLLAAGSVALLWVFTTPLAALLSFAAIGFYVVIYTLWLKRRSEQNIIWGGIAGCFPVLIGWAAVTGDLSVEAWILFLVVFLWTPPHYWPLSMKYREDYDNADVPMLAVVRTAPVVGVQVILYAWATVAASLLLVPLAPMGVLYTTVALVTGGWFIFESHRLYARSLAGEDMKPMKVFGASISYLSLLFVSVGVDPLLPW
ncbi:heme o synthase [Pontimonas sp.]|nr:heme o synthase [Pontimonas sp.]